MKVLTVIGARPQFIKAAPVSRAIRARGHNEYIVHTGQHYDYGMSQTFFDELHIPKPDVNLRVGSGSHGEQTGRMLPLVEYEMINQNPDLVLVYGDTNSTMVAALAAAKLRIPVAHVEAGLRSFDRDMPEEINRVVTDHVSTLLFCTAQGAVEQLAAEGIMEGVIVTGDVMLDAFEYDRQLSQSAASGLSHVEVPRGQFILMTLHRPANTDQADMLRLRMEQVSAVNLPVIWPIHPRAKAALQRNEIVVPPNVHTIEPQGRIEMIRLLEDAAFIVTDSGGLQKEAYWAKVPCFTLRNETEWVETVKTGWNTLIPPEHGFLREVMLRWDEPAKWPPLYGDGEAAKLIALGLERFDVTCCKSISPENAALRG